MVKKIELDYLRDGSGLAGVGRILLAIGVILAIAATMYYGQLRRQAAAIETDMAQLQGGDERSSRQQSEWAAGEKTGEVEAVQAAMGRMTLPWEDLFQALEKVDVETIRLIAIEPDAQKGGVRITAEADLLDDMLNYVRDLGRQAVLRDVFVVSHEVRDEDPDVPIRFTLTANWVKTP